MVIRQRTRLCVRTNLNDRTFPPDQQQSAGAEHRSQLGWTDGTYVRRVFRDADTDFALRCGPFRVTCTGVDADWLLQPV